MLRMNNVGDIYKYTSTHNTPMLSNFDADFWEDYVTNYTIYDKAFKRLYRSFKPLAQDPLDDIDVTASEFTDDVYQHLMLHSKKYSELFRIHSVSDEDYSIIDNYDITETMQKSGEVENATILGERHDSESHTIGGKSDSKSITHGAYQKTTSESLGQRADSKSLSYGAVSKTTSESLGQRSDSSSYTQGSQQNTTTDKVAPYDSETFYNNRNAIDAIGQRSDSTSTTTGAQSNSGSESINAHSDSESITVGAQSNSGSESVGAHTDSESITLGSQSNTDSFTKGQQINSENEINSEEYELRKKGNIGVMTSTDVMKRARDFWSSWDFYTYIFGEIAKDLLIV